MWFQQFVVFLSVLSVVHLAFVNPDNYIINGINSVPQPHHTYIRNYNINNVTSFGGGSLISNLHVLTSGYNINGYVFWKIGLGSIYFDSLIWFYTSNGHTHPSFNALTAENDIGILTLPNRLSLTANIAPISLPPLAILTIPLENEQGRILGYGFTSNTNVPAHILQAGFQRVISNDRCLETFPNIQLPHKFCAMDNIENANICQGDTGGGFITFFEGTPILVGIISNTIETCGYTHPAAYTRVTHYIAWIYNNIF